MADTVLVVPNIVPCPHGYVDPKLVVPRDLFDWERWMRKQAESRAAAADAAKHKVLDVAHHHLTDALALTRAILIAQEKGRARFKVTDGSKRYSVAVEREDSDG